MEIDGGSDAYSQPACCLRTSIIASINTLGGFVLLRRDKSIWTREWDFSAFQPADSSGLAPRESVDREVGTIFCPETKELHGACVMPLRITQWPAMMETVRRLLIIVPFSRRGKSAMGAGRSDLSPVPVMLALGEMEAEGSGVQG